MTRYSRMFCGASLAALLAATGAAAQERTFDIASGPASSAIPMFARQAGVQIIAPAARLKGVVTPALKGRQDARVALKTFLVGTNLEIASDNGSVVILRQAGAAPAPQAGPTPAAAAPVSAPTDPADDGAASVTEVVVTGSRVIRNGNNSPTPITVLPADDIQRVQPTTIADGLNQLPVFSSPRNQYGNPNAGVGGGAGGNAAANQLNLRNLGSVRNLILLDGHRVPPTSVNGIVDVDMVPQMLLQRVDTVTGGVSAVYGSDAVTGVVNFITDTKFTGVKLSAQAGVSKYGDAEQQSVGVAYGTNFADARGHFEISYEHRNDEGVARRSDRPWFHQQSISGAGTTAAPYQLYSDVRLLNFPFGGKITNGVLANQYFAANGVLSPFANGAAINGSTCCQVGGAGGYYDSSLKAPLRSDQVYGRVDYDVTETVHGYVAASFNDKRNEQFLTPPLISNVTMNSANAFLAPAYQAQLATAGQTTFAFSKMFDQAPRLNPVAEERQYTINAGLDGKFGDYSWGINYTHGSARLATTLNANPNNQRLAAALDAVINPATGQPVCYAALANSAYANCIPLNVFGPTSANEAAINYIMGSTHMTADTGLDALTGEIGGSPFSTWAGPVNVALSGEYRKLKYHSTSDALPTDRANCSGLRYNCTAATALYQNTFAARTPVSDTVKEVAAEVDVPLLADFALAKSLNLNGAARYTSYETSGKYWTWKLGVDWHLTDDLRVRGARSRDIRAPTLDDLYAPASVNTLTNKDELTGLTPGLSAGTSPVPGLSAGNAGLKAEIGHTSTLGVVWQALPRLSFALDAYWIKITDAISNIQGFNPTIQKACYDSGGSSPYCALQTRPLGYANTTAANLVTSWTSTVINISEIESNGVDFEANYSGALFGRPLSLRGLASYQPHIYYRTPALVTIDAAGSAFGTNGLQASPKWRLTGFFRYAVTDTVTIDVMERWRSALKHSADPTQVWTNNHLGTFATTNVNLLFKPKNGFGDAEYFLNVQNLFNATPPATAFFGAATIPGQFGGFAIGDDPTGRYVTIGARMKF
ncbi:TonB-dependent receptor domain-containing protein [Caulobacter sp. LARHSG274]